MLATALSPLGSAVIGNASTNALKRVRPGDPLWPATEDWEKLGAKLDGQLAPVTSPLSPCATPDSQPCRELITHLQNPYYLGDQPGATQIWGWAHAWISMPSAYVVAAKTPHDIAAAVNFAREKNLRLVVKGGGHSYQGTSNAPDSLLIWTRSMNAINLHNAFVCRSAPADQQPAPAVTIGAGALWMDAYDAVTSKAGRYVQGGGCGTVGVAGLIQGGGFGSFSKKYGLAASHLLQAEIVTADGEIRIANSFRNADLFWALKGGGGGSLGVVTRLTLKTHELPAIFGDVSVKLKAASAPTFRKLIALFLNFYSERLFNPHWGESVRFGRNNLLAIDMTFQGLQKEPTEKLWHEFLNEMTTALPDVTVEAPLFIEALPAHKWWDVDYLEKYSQGSVLVDNRPGAPRHHAWWTGDKGQVGSFIQGYKSNWLPAGLLDASRREQLADALFSASRHWSVSLHFNKGLAGSPVDTQTEIRNTAINPAAFTAFALAIIAADTQATYSGEEIRNPELADAKDEAEKISRAMAELQRVAPDGGSYLSESDFFEANWQNSFWGANYPRLLRVKKKYDPDGLFFVRHGVGSEDWTDDGFSRHT